MNSRRVLSLLSLGALVLGAAAFGDPIVDPEASTTCRLIRGVDTDDTGDDVEACRQDVWFHANATKAGNTGAITGFPTWDTTPPDTSVAGGAGGGSLATSASHQTGSPFDPNAAFHATGTYTGAIDTLAVELYLFPPAGMAQSETTFRIDAQLVVDGNPVGSIGDLTVPMETAGDAVQRVRFAWTELDGIIEAYGGALEGEHAVELTVHGTGLGSNAAMFVYDTTEVPGGMVFNIDPSELTDVPTVAAF